jgi:hypothetical protein
MKSIELKNKKKQSKGSYETYFGKSSIILNGHIETPGEVITIGLVSSNLSLPSSYYYCSELPLKSISSSLDKLYIQKLSKILEIQ